MSQTERSLSKNLQRCLTLNPSYSWFRIQSYSQDMLGSYGALIFWHSHGQQLRKIFFNKKVYII